MMKRACLACHAIVEANATINGRCRPCANAKQRAYDASRGGAVARGYGHAWRKVRAEILERDGWCCAYCGGPASTVDHRLPKIEGGTDDPTNLVGACKPCNTGRENARRAVRVQHAAQKWRQQWQGGYAGRVTPLPDRHPAPAARTHTKKTDR